MIYGIPILSKEWIDFVWDSRKDAQFNASDVQLTLKFKLEPFTRLKISLYNYSPEEENELTQCILQNNGKVVSIGDGETSPIIAEDCTHLVIKDSQNINLCSFLEKSIHLPRYVVSDKVITHLIPLIFL